MRNIKTYFAIAFVLILAVAINFAIAQDTPQYDPSPSQQVNMEVQNGLQSLTRGIGMMMQGQAMIESAEQTSSEELKNSRKIVGEDMLTEGGMAVENGLEQVRQGKTKMMEMSSVSTSSDEIIEN